MEQKHNARVLAGSRLLHVLRQPTGTRLFLVGGGGELSSIDIVDRSLTALHHYGFALGEETPSSCVVSGGVLVVHSEDTETVSGYRLEDGKVVFRHVPGLGVFALPRGEHVGVLCGEERVSVQRLLPPYGCVDVSERFKHLDLDAPNGAYFYFDQANSLGHLLIACYGFCQLLDLKFEKNGYPYLFGRGRILREGVVMDPVYLREAQGPRVALWHGYGGVAMVDLVEGRIYHCPAPEGERPQYGLFSHEVRFDSDSAVLVSTKQGRYWWRLGGGLVPIPPTDPEFDQSAILVNRDFIVCLGNDALTIVQRRGSSAP